jgi:hypothetical protein
VFSVAAGRRRADHGHLAIRDHHRRLQARWRRGAAAELHIELQLDGARGLDAGEDRETEIAAAGYGDLGANAVGRQDVGRKYGLHVRPAQAPDLAGLPPPTAK